ncbi:MAG: metallophosphoesterase [Promethearchaeota archaeon]
MKKIIHKPVYIYFLGLMLADLLLIIIFNSILIFIFYLSQIIGHSIKYNNIMGLLNDYLQIYNTLYGNIFYTLYIIVYLAILIIVTFYAYKHFISITPSIYKEYKWNAGPWLSYRGDPSSSIVINWITAEKVPSIVLFGTSMDDMKEIGNYNAPSKVHHVEIKDLKPNTRYFYKLKRFDFKFERITGFKYNIPLLLKNKSLESISDVLEIYPLNKDIFKGIYSFKTPVPSKSISGNDNRNSNSDAQFSFVVFGDTQNGGGLGDLNWGLRAILNSIFQSKLDEEIDLILSVGDVSDQGNDIRSWHAFLSHISLLASERPLHIAVGNHDTGTNYLSDPEMKKHPDGGVNFDTLFNYFYESSPDEDRIPAFKSRYYSLTYANTLFLFLDTQNRKLAEPNNPQWRFIEDKLKKCPPNFWKIALIHWPLIEVAFDKESGQKYLKETHYAKYFIPLFEKYGIDLVITGHAHLFSAILINDQIKYADLDYRKYRKRSNFLVEKPIFQIISGGAGNNLRENAPIITPEQNGIRLINEGAQNKRLINDLGSRFGDIADLKSKIPYHENSTHYLLVNIKGNTLEIKAIKPGQKEPTNEVFWSLKIKKE